MNQVLLSSKRMDWCTPQDFFDDLNREFTLSSMRLLRLRPQNVRCISRPKRTDFRKAGITVVQYSAIRRMGARLENG